MSDKDESPSRRIRSSYDSLITRMYELDDEKDPGRILDLLSEAIESICEGLLAEVDYSRSEGTPDDLDEITSKVEAIAVIALAETHESPAGSAVILRFPL